MTSKPKGLALIFKVVSYYYEMGDPSVADVDGERLEQLFTGIGYNVQVIRDPLSARHFETQLKDLLATHAIGDSVIVAVLARASNEGMICCNGDIFSVNKIVSILGNADVYLDKPKLIFIQARRGSRLTQDRIEPSSPVKLPLREAKEGMSTMYLPTISRNPVESDAASLDARQDEEREDSASLPLDIPAHSHVLIDYVTFPGFVSRRNLRKGSWYIQSLVEVFSKDAFKDDVFTLLTSVHRMVSREFKTMQDFRQIPDPQSTLKKSCFSSLDTSRMTIILLQHPLRLKSVFQ